MNKSSYLGNHLGIGKDILSIYRVCLMKLELLSFIAPKIVQIIRLQFIVFESKNNLTPIDFFYFEFHLLIICYVD